MKKLFSFIITALLCIGTANADEFALHKAIQDLVNNKNVSVERSILKDVYRPNAKSAKQEWQIIHYTFTIKSGNSKKLLDRLVNAYDRDLENPMVNAAYQLTGDNVSYSIEYCDNHAPVELGWPGTLTSSLLICGTEKPEVNTVLAIAWRDIYRTNMKPMVGGEIYIIDRSPSYVKVKDEDELQSYENENIRRLQFYSSKYRDQIMINQTGANIVKATIFVVDDIIRNGSASDKAQAKEILDYMISIVPSSSFSSFTLSKQQEAKESANTLLNLLQRLSADFNPAQFESTPTTFTINGHIDDELWDIGYYIYTSDDEMNINTNESELVKAEGQNFYYKADLSDVKLGRVRALFKDGTVCSAWIDMLFVPGETAELSVHNGYYSLSGSGFYRQLSDAMRCMLGTPEEKIAYALDHIDEPGALCIIFKEGGLDHSDLQRIYEAVPEDIRSSQYGVYLRKHLN